MLLSEIDIEKWPGLRVRVPHKTQTRVGVVTWDAVVLGVRDDNRPSRKEKKAAKVRPLNASRWSVDKWVDASKCEVIA